MWAKLMGESATDLTGNLVTGHPHEMVAGLLALLMAVVAWRFGYQALEGRSKVLAQIGLWFVMAGTTVMTIMYVIGGFTAIEPPIPFTFGPAGVNGLAMPASLHARQMRIAISPRLATNTFLKPTRLSPHSSRRQS